MALKVHIQNGLIRDTVDIFISSCIGYFVTTVPCKGISIFCPLALLAPCHLLHAYEDMYKLRLLNSGTFAPPALLSVRIPRNLPSFGQIGKPLPLIMLMLYVHVPKGLSRISRAIRAGQLFSCIVVPKQATLGCQPYMMSLTSGESPKHDIH